MDRRERPLHCTLHAAIPIVRVRPGREVVRPDVVGRVPLPAHRALHPIRHPLHVRLPGVVAAVFEDRLPVYRAAHAQVDEVPARDLRLRQQVPQDPVRLRDPPLRRLSDLPGLLHVPPAPRQRPLQVLPPPDRAGRLQLVHLLPDRPAPRQPDLPLLPPLQDARPVQTVHGHLRPRAPAVKPEPRPPLRAMRPEVEDRLPGPVRGRAVHQRNGRRYRDIHRCLVLRYVQHDAKHAPHLHAVRRVGDHKAVRSVHGLPIVKIDKVPVTW